MSHELGRFDTSIAANARMKEFDLRMGVLLEKVKKYPTTPSKWIIGAEPSSGSTTAAAEKETESINISEIEQTIISEWTKKLEASKTEMMKYFSQQEKSVASENNNKTSSSTSSLKLLTIHDVESFCFNHPSWQNVSKSVTQQFMVAFRDQIAREVGPLIPPADFIAKNRMYPVMKSIDTKNQKEVNAAEVALSLHFIRQEGFADSLFSCCSVSREEEYRNALELYDRSFVSAMLKPTEKEMMTTTKSNESGAVIAATEDMENSIAYFELILWRAKVLLEATQQIWLPVSLVCQNAIITLQQIIKKIPRNASTIQLQADFSKILSSFAKIATSAGTQQQTTISGVTLTAVVDEDEDETSGESGSSNNNNKKNSKMDLWTLLESFLHIIVSAHFHCDALFQRHYPKNLSSVSTSVIPLLKKMVWRFRRGIISKCAVAWCNSYAIGAIDRLVEDASTNAMMKLTSPTPNSASAAATATDEDPTRVDVDEPSQPFRPGKDEVMRELNDFLDGFIERYRELVGGAVKLSIGAAAASSESSGLNTCCMYCTRGLHQALSKIVLEQNDALLVKTLQNRLRQKLIVAFVSSEKDKEVVKNLLVDVARNVWKVSVGGDLEQVAEEMEKETSNNKDEDKLPSAIAHEEASTFSPANADDSTVASATSRNRSDSASPSPSRQQNQKEIELYESRFRNAGSLKAIAAILQNAKNRVVWHASSEMTRLTDAVTEYVASKRCPKALAAFANTYVRQLSAAAQPHLMTQAQSLLAAKELSRISERLCDMGKAAGGPQGVANSNRNSAQIIEINRTLEQMEALLSRFPRAPQNEPNPELDISSDVDNDDSDEQQVDGKGNNKKKDVDNDSLAWNRNSSFDKAAEDTSNVYAQMAKVLPLYRMRQSWELYSNMAKEAS